MRDVGCAWELHHHSRSRILSDAVTIDLISELLTRMDAKHCIVLIEYGAVDHKLQQICRLILRTHRHNWRYPCQWFILKVHIRELGSSFPEERLYP